jgi:hypothetical protein
MGGGIQALPPSALFRAAFLDVINDDGDVHWMPGLEPCKRAAKFTTPGSTRSDHADRVTGFAKEKARSKRAFSSFDEAIYWAVTLVGGRGRISFPS